MEHQRLAVERGRSSPHLGIFFEAGTGKTATMIRILCEEYNTSKRIAPTLIFAPLSVCAQWKTEFAKFSKIPEEKIYVATGTGSRRVKDFKSQPIVVTNYESVQITGFYAKLCLFRPEILVLDESHRIKDSTSKRAKLIYPLANQAKRRFLLTGTPILNSLMDIFGQFKALDPDVFGPGFWTFRSSYFYNKNAGKQFSFPDWVPYPHAAKTIGKKIAAHSVQAKLSDCLDLPPLVQIQVPVAMGDAQSKAFKEMKKDFLTEVKGSLCTAEFAMTKALRLLQVTSGYIQPDDGAEPVWFDDVPRLQALSECLESIGDHKVIVWTTFRATYKKIGDLIEKQGKSYAFLTGEQSYREKENAIESFSRGDTQVLVSNPAAGGIGINFEMARYSIYYNRSYSLEQWLQSQARNYRHGSERHPSVIQYALHSPGTLDAIIAAALSGKRSVADAVLEWALDTSLNQE